LVVAYEACRAATHFLRYFQLLSTFSLHLRHGLVVSWTT
jgi:hypothetical protein